MQGYNCIMVLNAKADKVLFCKRLSDPYKGMYNLVGGKINRGENGFAAAYRELAEETGIGDTDIELSHMMDFSYYNQGCYVEVYTGQLREDVALVPEKHPLHWLPLTENFFDQSMFAGEGNIGHMVEQLKQYGPGLSDISAASKAVPAPDKTVPAGSRTAPTADTDAPASTPDRAVKDEPFTILCYGDSNTYGYNPVTSRRHGENTRWTMVLQKLLGSDFRVIEEGCNGRTSYNYVVDNPWKTGDYGMKAILNSHKPIDLLVMMLGSNDLKNLYDSSVQDIADAVGRLLEEAAGFLLEQQEFVPKLLLISPPEIDSHIEESFFGDKFDNSSFERSLQMADVFAKTAADFRFKDTKCHFLNAAEFVKPSEHDCLHLDADQHIILARAIHEKLLREIV